MSRSLKLLLLAPLLVAATPYQAQMLPTLILPNNEIISTLGVEQVVKDDETVLEAPLGWVVMAEVGNDLELSFSGLTSQVKAGDMMHGTILTGGDLVGRQLGFCMYPKSDLAKSLASALTLGISDLATKISKDTQFCVYDVDQDGNLDHSLLVGAKSKELIQQMVIADTPYTVVPRMKRDESERFWISYHKGGAFGGSPRLDLHLKEDRINGYLSDLKAQRGSEVYQLPLRVKLDPKLGRQSVTIAGAKILVTEFAKDNSWIKAEIERNFDETPVQGTFTVY
ncbi:hypothetical protein [Novosphingopyxis sp.]|uniref:hypothetical protein n=1 Tax=Novosphingopyxis sp. TaxID=2709690 RepID=UPI003B5C947E